MRIKRKKKAGMNIADSGALSDLAFLLIVFFIVIAVFNLNTGFILDLPRKDASQLVHKDDLMRIELRRDNRLYYNNALYSDEDIRTFIGDFAAENPEMTLQLTIDGDALYQRVVDVILMSREMDLERFSFTMSDGDEG